MRSIFVIFILCFLTACGKKKPEEVREAIDLAQTYLSEAKCTEAIKVLEEVGRQNKDPVYLQVLASAFACRAGFSEISFIANDVTAINSASAGLMRSLSILSLSNETTTDSAQYQDIWTALEILLESDGGTQPSQENREAYYGPRKAGDMGVQALLLSIVQLGKFLNHFGNVDAAGAKGLGPGSNTCFLNYSYSNAQTVISGLPSTNNCNSNTDGHADLDLSTDAGKRRACEGLMLITNVIDILTNIDLSGSSSLGSLETMATTASTFKTNATTADPALATLLDITSVTDCVTTLASASEQDNMQLIYALIFEAGLE